MNLFSLGLAESGLILGVEHLVPDGKLLQGNKITFTHSSHQSRTLPNQQSTFLIRLSHSLSTFNFFLNLPYDFVYCFI